MLQLRRYELKSVEIGVFEETESLCPKISGRRGRPLQTHSSCQKARMNDRSCGIRIRTQVSFVLSQSTRLTDREIDEQWERIALDISCVVLQCHAVVR